MRRSTGLFERVVDEDALEHSARLAVRNKRRRPDVAAFLFRRESALRGLRSALLGGRWRHGPFDLLLLRDPKPRVIARAGVEDRIVHTALALGLETAVGQRLTCADFACRAGMGTHRALLRLLELTRSNAHFVHLDIRSYFPSIDLEVLRRRLERYIRDRRFLALLDRVLEAGRGLYDAPAIRSFARMDADWPPCRRGLPIGAYTSQVLASHVYLLGLDEFVLRNLRPGGYVRYVDDLVLFDRSRARVRSIRDSVRQYLEQELHLRLKHPQARVRSCGGALDVLGHRITRQGIVPFEGHAKRLAARAARWVREGGSHVAGRWDGAVGSVLVV